MALCAEKVSFRLTFSRCCYMTMARIPEEGPLLRPMRQLRGDKRPVAPRGDHVTYVEAPVRIEVIKDPVIADHRRKLCDRRA